LKTVAGVGGQLWLDLTVHIVEVHEILKMTIKTNS